MWEYRTVFCKLGDLSELNALGGEGWEAVGLAGRQAGTQPGYTVLLKRRVPAPQGSP